MMRFILSTVVLGIIGTPLLAQTNPTSRPTDGFTMFGAPVTPATVHVHAVDLPLESGDCLTARYEWDFGDPGGRYNTLIGWNAAHVYDSPGTYTIRLTLTDEAGRTRRLARTITVGRRSDRAIYVAAGGNDSGDGRTPQTAKRTLSAAVAVARSGDSVLLRGGERFATSTTIRIIPAGLLIGAYRDAGSGDLPPTVLWIGPRQMSPMIETSSAARDVVIDGLGFDVAFPTEREKPRMPVAIRPVGSNITVRSCVFYNVCDGINSNARPVGVVMQDCVSPHVTGLRGYLAWIEGRDQAYLGNVVANSTREAPMRIGFLGADRVLIANNDLANLNRTNIDPIDIAKNALTVHCGNHVYISGNTISAGNVHVGPLGEGDGFRQPNKVLSWVVFEDNRCRGSTLRVNHGTKGLMVRNNRIWTDDLPAIMVQGFNREYNRVSSDVTIAHNTAQNDGTRGGFVRVTGRVDGVRLVNNLYVAPNLRPGEDRTAILYVAQGDLGSFREIRGNVWPITRPLAYTRGGEFYIWPSWVDARRFLNLRAWMDLPVTTQETQIAVAVDGELRPGGDTAALRRRRVAGVSHDSSGAARDSQRPVAGAIERR